MNKKLETQVRYMSEIMDRLSHNLAEYNKNPELAKDPFFYGPFEQDILTIIRAHGHLVKELKSFMGMIESDEA